VNFCIQDAAASENIMKEIIRVAKDERMIILCTIHQPSTKVYNGFDQVMILSQGREAYTGPVSEATSYFEEIGYPLPVQTNPAGKYNASQQQSLAQSHLLHIILMRSWLCSLLFSRTLSRLGQFGLQ
jgi:ABC-type multidrug transport system ATPase subunit